jgi:hypothetical protein
MLSVASHIKRANVADQSLQFPWDGSNTQVAEGETDTDLVDRLSAISQRANVAYATSLTEWILGRFRTFPGLEDAYNYVEASWAMAIDLRYCRVVWQDFPNSLRPGCEKWEGPIKGPVELAMLRLQETIGSLVEEGDPEYTASKLWQLACHVMPSSEALRKLREWNDIIWDRMKRTAARAEGDLLGDVVPRDFFDPGLRLPLEDLQATVNQFLMALIPAENPFLNTTQRMREEGFEGTPYTFDLSLDRERRVLR